MSLINQMLKDLESRKADGGQSRPESLRRGGSSMLPWAITAVLGVIVLVLAVMFWQLQNQSALPAVDVARSLPSEPVAETQSPSAGNDKAAQDTSITRTDASALVEKPADPPKQEVIQEPDPVPAPVESPSVASAEGRGETRPAATVSEPPATSKPAAREEPASTETTVEEGSMVIAPSRLSPREQAEASLQRGFAAMSRRDYSRATDEFMAGLAILPAEDEARMSLYQALRRQGRVAEAEGVLETGITDGREPHRFAEQLARNYAARGQVPMAISLLAVAPPSVAADPEYHALWGALLQQQGDYAAARPIYESLVAVNPQNGAWLAGLGITQQQTGEPAAALSSYQAALAAGGMAAAVEDYVKAQVQALSPEEDE